MLRILAVVTLACLMAIGSKGSEMEKVDQALAVAIKAAEGEPVPVLVTCKTSCTHVVKHLTTLKITDFQIIDEIKLVRVTVDPAEILSLSEVADVEWVELDAEVQLD